MYKILSLICIIAAAVTAFFLASWIKSRRGSGDDTVRLYGIIKSRNSNFWAFHYIPVIAFTVLIALAAGAGIDWIHAAACLAGSIISFLAVYAGSVAFVPGSVSSYSQADAGDIRTSIRASYRSGAVLGLCISALVTAVLLAALVIGNAAAIDVTFGTVPDSWGGALNDDVKQQIIDKVNDE